MNLKPLETSILALLTLDYLVNSAIQSLFFDNWDLDDNLLLIKRNNAL